MRTNMWQQSILDRTANDFSVQSNAFKIKSQCKKAKGRRGRSQFRLRTLTLNPSRCRRDIPVSTKSPCAKQLKIRLLTAANTPDIVSAVVQALPPQTDAESTRLSYQTRERPPKLQLRPDLAAAAGCLETRRTRTRIVSDHEDFGE